MPNVDAVQCVFRGELFLKRVVGGSNGGIGVTGMVYGINSGSERYDGGGGTIFSSMAAYFVKR